MSCGGSWQTAMTYGGGGFEAAEKKWGYKCCRDASAMGKEGGVCDTRKLWRKVCVMEGISAGCKHL